LSDLPHPSHQAEDHALAPDHRPLATAPGLPNPSHQAEDPPPAPDHRPLATALAPILDFILGLDTNPPASSDTAPIARSSQQTEAATADRDSAAPSPELVDLRTIEYFPAQLTAPESPNRSGESQPSLKTQKSKLKTASEPSLKTGNSKLKTIPTPPTPDSGLQTRDSSATLQPLPENTEAVVAPSGLPYQEIIQKCFADFLAAQHPAPESPNPCGESEREPKTENSKLKTASSESELKTEDSKLKTISPLDHQLHHISRSLTRRKYGRYEDIRFGDVIQEIIDNEHLTVDKAIEGIRWRTRMVQPLELQLVEQGIYAFLNPDAPPPPPPLRGIDRYLRPVPSDP
jgi:hypothetical protein